MIDFLFIVIGLICIFIIYRVYRIIVIVSFSLSKSAIVKGILSPSSVALKIMNCSAPLYPQLKALAEMGVDVDVIIGGREAQYVLSIFSCS